MGRFPFYQAERSQSPSFMVHLPRFLEVLDLIGWLMGHIYSHSLCSWACSLELSQSQLAFCYISRGSQVSGNPRYPDSAFFFNSPEIFPLNGWVELPFFLCFIRPKAYLFMGLGSFLLIFSSP